MNPISTGYKPEYGLGAVYQGINAADSEALNQEEIIKAFLANQREQQSMPMDMDIKGLQAAQARQQNTPDMLQSFMKDKQAGYNKNIREDEIGSLMQPFRKEQAPLQGQREVETAKLDSNLAHLQNLIHTGTDSNGNPLSQPDLAILNQEYNKLVGIKGNSPEYWAKTGIENTKGDWDLRKQQLANEGHQNTARITSEKNHAMEVNRALTTVTTQIKGLNDNLAKLEGKEIENQWIADFMAQGKKKPEAQALAKQKQSALKMQLQQEKEQMQRYQTFLLSQVPGMQNMPASPSTEQKVIKLD
jgi:hypothetical protein